MKVDAHRAKAIATALAAARKDRSADQTALDSALTTVMRSDPTLEALFDRRSSTVGPPRATAAQRPKA